MECAEEFVEAAEHGEMEDVISFLKTGVDINVQVGYVSRFALIAITVCALLARVITLWDRFQIQ